MLWSLSWSDRVLPRRWPSLGSTPSRWPRRSAGRQTATWCPLRGLPPDSLGTGSDQLGPQLDQLDGRQGAEVGSGAAFHDQEPILPPLHIEHVVVAELIQPLASYLRRMPHHRLHVRSPRELAYGRLREYRDCSA